MSPINWQDVITTLGGNAVLLAVGAWLLKTLLTNRLALDVEKFKIQMKADADAEIERVKAFLIRASRVHERQIEPLTRLYRHFLEAQGYLQRMAATGRFSGEVSVEEYGRLCATAIASAHDELLQSRLLIPPDLARQCDAFFRTLFEGQSNLAYAQHPMVVNALQRAEFWDRAKNTAYNDIPKLLEQIEKAARTVIHGEVPTTYS